MSTGSTDESAARSVSALWSLAVRAADEGAYGRVSELFAAAAREGLAPSDAGRWQRLLVEAGDFAAARQAAALGGRELGAAAPSGTGAAGGAGSEAEDDDFLDFEPGQRDAAAPAVPDQVVATFLRWFGGRGDVHARQWYDARRDRSGYWPVREPLTARVVEQHLLGRYTVGQYLLYPDNTVSFAVLDFDPTAEALEQARLVDTGEGALGFQRLMTYAAHVVATAAALGLRAAAEDTGGVGLHIWLFFEPRLPAARARAVLRELLWRAGPQPPAVTVELFPKQDHLSGKGLGNLIKLPLGVHQVTLRPSQFLDTNMRPTDGAQALAALCACDPAAIETVLAKRIVALPAAATAEETQAVRTAPLPPQGPTPRALAAALAAIPPGRAAARAADRMLAGCAVLRELSRRASEERRLPADAARALLYSVGLAGRQNDRIEALFAQAGVSRKELDRACRGLQGPVGCKKLRERFPQLAQGCACPAAPPGGYASPALFALQEPPALRRHQPPWPEPPDLAEDPADRSVVEVERRLARIEATLQKLLNERDE